MSEGTASTAPTSVWTPAPSDPPILFGHYRIVGILGKGGMGTVFEGYHLNLKRTVAIKTLRVDLIGRPHLVSRFLGEMESIGQMDHPNVVRATDAGEKNGIFYLVMEYLRGMDLGRLVAKQGPLDPATACELTRQAAVGLAYIHRTLIHRDIKPSNLMLTPDGRVKILDLGLARFTEPDADGVEQTPPGCAVGTFAYMAPEQARGNGPIDSRADLFSLGCTLFKLLTGRTPFSLSSPDATPRQSNIPSEGPVLGEELRAVPEPLQPVLLRMTARNPEERFASADEVARALAPFAAGATPAQLLDSFETVLRPAPAPLPRPLPVEISLLATSQPETRSKPADIPPPPRPRRWGRVLLGVAGLACVLGLLAWFNPGAQQRRETGPPPSAEVDVISLPLPAAPVVSLDALKPLEHHDLLRRSAFPPQLVGFRRGDGLASGRWMPPRQQVEITPTSTVLIQLATVGKDKPGFTFQTLIDQRPWSGWVGLFWGYQPVAATDPPAPDRPFSRFQMLLLTRGRDKAGGVQFFVERATATLREVPEQGISLGVRKNLARHALPSLANEKVFEVVVENGRLQQARFGGTDLTALCTHRINKQFRPSDYTGAVGLITLSANMTIRRPWVMPHADH